MYIHVYIYTSLNRQIMSYINYICILYYALFYISTVIFICIQFIGKWNSAELLFSPENCIVTLNDKTVLISDLSSTKAEEKEKEKNHSFFSFSSSTDDASAAVDENKEGGRVGLSAWNCGGVGFDNVSLRPPYLVSSEKNGEKKSKLKNRLSSFYHSIDTNSGSNKNDVLHNQEDSFIPSSSSSLSSNEDSRTFKSSEEDSTCNASHIVDRKSQCIKLFGFNDDDSNDYKGRTNKDSSFHPSAATNLILCQFNFCEICCNKFVSSFFESKNLNGGNQPKSRFQLQLLQEEAASIKRRCLLVSINHIIINNWIYKFF